MSWFPFSIVATALLGVAMALYKLPSAKNLDRFAVTFWSLFIPLIFSFALFSSYHPLASGKMMWAAFLWGVSFTCIALLQMYALNHVDTNVLFPVTTTLSMIATIIFGIFFFLEYPTLLQLAGILIAVAAVYAFLYKGGKFLYSALVLIVGTSIIFISVFNKILQKIVAGNFDIHVFQIYQYLFASLFALAVFFAIHRKDAKAHISWQNFKIGAIIGVFSFLGGYALLIALTKGPFPLITAIHSQYTFVTAVVAATFFRENITRKKLFLIALSILAVLLMRLG